MINIIVIMKTLVLLRGAPGCGKSTWIKSTFNPEKTGVYPLSADEIRLMFQSPTFNVDGSQSISQLNDIIVWKILFEVLEARMQKGEFCIIDATNSKTSEMTRYRDMAKAYRYRIYLVDFTDIDIDIVKERNANRMPKWKRVPEEVIDNQYSRFKTQTVPSGISVIKPEDIDSILNIKPYDCSNTYKKVYAIGDVHGCYSCLLKFWNEKYSDDNLYIFTGDYIDRGIENVEVLKFLLEHAYNKKNVILLEGNHETWIRKYSNNEDTSASKQFQFNTKKQLDKAVEEGVFDKKSLRQLSYRFSQYAYIRHNGRDIFLCHGGVTEINPYMSAQQIIKGVGKYEDSKLVADTWIKNNPNIYHVFGHRNVDNSDIKLNDRVYCLEGKIEFGGNLRVVEFSDTINTYEYKNDIFVEKAKQKQNKQAMNINNVEQFIQDARSNKKNIVEKQMCNNSDISSFNFSRQIFNSGKWDSMNIKARGLFIDTKNNNVVARSYNKFFNLNEREETSIQSLKNNLKYPIKAYIKENGFLGIVSYYNSEFFIASKSTNSGPYAEVYFKKLFDETFPEGSAERDILRATLLGNKTAVFEVIDIENDPHIIEYSKSKIVLLDVIDNDINTCNKLPYRDLVKLSNIIGVECKSLYKSTINNHEELLQLIDAANNINFMIDNKPVEGFVFEDQSGYQFKLKTAYYNTWKSLRSIVDEVIKKGYSDHTSKLLTPLMNYFYKFVKDYYSSMNNKEERQANALDIIKLRNMYYDSVK